MKRFLLWAAFALAFSAATPAAHAQVSMYTTVLITPSVVYGWGVTDMESGADWIYYSAEADVYLFEDSTIIETNLYHPSDGTWVAGDVSAGAESGHSYWIWTNHMLVPFYYDDPFGYCDEDGYSSLSPADFSPSGTVYSPDTFTYSSSGSIYVGSSTDATNSYAPTISGIDQTTYGTAQADTSGYVIVYGNYLATMAGATTITIDGVTVSISWDDWTYPVQLNGYYSIPYSTSAGSHTLTITTPFGSATATFTVYPAPAPYITGITTSGGGSIAVVMVGGSSTRIGVAGTYFGGTACPISVNLPFGVSQTTSPYNCSDGYFDIYVQADFTTAIGDGAVSISTSGGTSNSFDVLFNGPASMVVVSDFADRTIGGTLIGRDTNYAVENADYTVANGPDGSSGLFLAESGYFTWGVTCYSGGTVAPEGFVACDSTQHTAAGSTFTDSWGDFEADTPSYCYGTINWDHWQWCGGVGGPGIGITFATLSGVIGTNFVTNDGLTMPPDSNQLPAGTRFTP